ncbi:hypothetical protein F4825DRAFT_409197 [Nemania diffusa]|nr:hypothetical protein F4825DRAFT_409197 [Nemania diffusa]
MDALTRKLIDELRPLLDEATILAISSDYDLQQPQQFTAARDVLLAISVDAAKEEATGFNPSGFGGNELAGLSLYDGSAGHETMRSMEGDGKSSDGLTNTTEDSRSHSQSGLSGTSSKASAPDSPGIIHVSALDNLTDDEKERRLAAMFINLKPIDIRLTLQRTKGDADLAMGELLNLQFLEQTGQRPKGVDGFFVDDDDLPKGTKGKKKGRKRKYKPLKVVGASKTEAPRGSDTVAATEAPIRDEVIINDDIIFISNHFALAMSEATNIYKRNKSSLGATILAILDKYIALGWQHRLTPQELRKIKEQELRVPWIPRDYFNPIFQMTPTPQDAVAVIDSLAGHFKKPAYLKHNITYKIATSEPELVSGTPFSSTDRRSLTSPTTLQEASAAKATIAASMNHSFASASSAYRKGKSSGLMGQAAAFYADRARAEAASYREAISTEADLLVDAQSTEDTIDLHGVSVSDGVQIALDRAWRWWYAQRQEDKPRKAVRDAGLKIVTGLGRHNADGKSRLRINVCKALVADGWTIEINTGAYLITGRAR